MRVWLGVLAALLFPAAAQAVSLEPVGTFTFPIAATSPAGDHRLFVVERGGIVRIVDNGVTLPAPFLTIPPTELSTDGERGLLSMTFAPDYAQSGRFFTYSTDLGGDIRVDLWHRSADPNVASPQRALVLRIEHSLRHEHNGGDLHFGPDGLLYVSTGDGGGENDPDRNGQTLIRGGSDDEQSTALLGKLLRIDPGQAGGYTIPPDNPFVGRADARGEIYAYGLRNPFRFSFDRSNGALLIGDPGQDTAEEVDYSATRGRGANFGWRCYEGAQPSPGAAQPCPAPGHVAPVFEYGHGGGGCAITGGYVARDPTLPSLAGRYVYADYCIGDIRSIVPSSGAGDASTGIVLGFSKVVSFAEDACGRIYVVQRSGELGRLVEATTSPCTAALAAQPAPAPATPEPPSGTPPSTTPGTPSAATSKAPFKALVLATWKLSARDTTLLSLRVRAPVGARLDVRCAGRGCVFKRRIVKHMRRSPTSLTRSFGSKRRFSPGATITVRVTRKGPGIYQRMAIRRHSKPTVTRGCISRTGTLYRCAPSPG